MIGLEPWKQGRETDHFKSGTEVKRSLLEQNFSILILLFHYQDNIPKLKF